MIRKLIYENFRSIPKEQMELGKINIITGANNVGKSSIIYGLLALKNMMGNTNQSLDSCLTLPFMNLGGFGQVIFDKNESGRITLGIETDNHTRFEVHIGKNETELVIKPQIFTSGLILPISFPYPANKSTGTVLNKTDVGTAKVSWNGISATINFEKSGEITDEEIKKLTDEISYGFSAPLDKLRLVDYIPIKHGRGFTKPSYSAVAMQNPIIEEDQIATLLASDRDLEGSVSHYMERIVNRVFNVRPIIGQAVFYLQTRDRETGFVTDLVNEGFGTNQLVSILTKILKNDTELICIEELEIHLHPTIMNKFMESIIEIVKERNKQFIISTHSEHIILPLLNNVAKKNILPEDIRIYYLEKKGKRTQMEEQKVNEKGQIEGGLKSFYETELAQVDEFFKARE